MIIDLHMLRIHIHSKECTFSDTYSVHNIIMSLRKVLAQEKRKVEAEMWALVSYLGNHVYMQYIINYLWLYAYCLVDLQYLTIVTNTTDHFPNKLTNIANSDKKASHIYIGTCQGRSAIFYCCMPGCIEGTSG